MRADARPVLVRRAGAVAAACLLVLTGCGKSDANRADFVAKADVLCQKYRDKSAAIVQPSGGGEPRAKYFDDLAQVNEEGIAEFAKLKVPKSDRDYVANLNDDRVALVALLRQAAKELRAGNEADARRTVEQVGRRSKQLQERNRGFGFKVCGAAASAGDTTVASESTPAPVATDAAPDTAAATDTTAAPDTTSAPDTTFEPDTTFPPDTAPSDTEAFETTIAPDTTIAAVGLAGLPAAEDRFVPIAGFEFEELPSEQLASAEQSFMSSLGDSGAQALVKGFAIRQVQQGGEFVAVALVFEVSELITSDATVRKAFFDGVTGGSTEVADTRVAGVPARTFLTSDNLRGVVLSKGSAVYLVLGEKAPTVRRIAQALVSAQSN